MVEIADAKLYLALPFNGRLTDFLDVLKGLQASDVPQIDSLIKTDMTVWEKQPLSLNDDLHEGLADILGYREEGESASCFWQLSSPLRDALNKQTHIAPENANKAVASAVDMPSGTGLLLKLSKAACKRLRGKAPENGLVPLRITEVEFYLSQTRFGQLLIALECGLDSPDSALLVEIIHCLAHGKYGAAKKGGDGLWRVGYDPAYFRQQSLDSGGGKGKRIAPPPLYLAEQLNLFDLGRELICQPSDCDNCAIATPRAFSYVLASTHETLPLEQKKELTARFARRLNADYSPSDTLEGVEFAMPFTNITHGCSLEGGASIVSEIDNAVFLKDFVYSVGQSVYLKLALLAHKECHDLVALSQGSAIKLEHDDSGQVDILQEKLTRLKIYQERILNFRLGHRFSMASFSANHNLVHHAWRRAMGTDVLLQDIAGDVHEAENYLALTEQNLANRDLAYKTSWLQGFVAFLAVMEGTRALFDIIGSLFNLPNEESLLAEQVVGSFGKELAIANALDWEMIAMQVAPIAIGAAAGYFAWRFARKNRDG